MAPTKLTIVLDVTDFNEDQVVNLMNEIAAQTEASIEHPEARMITWKAAGKPPRKSR